MSSQAAPSIAQSKASITRSEVSQVDFKLQANNQKIKLKSLFKNIDSDKSGMVKHEVFFELLGLHRVQLSKEAISVLKRDHSKNQTINYKEAIN